MESGYNFTVSTFEKVDGSVAKLGDIKPNENVSFSGTDLQLLDAEGATDTIELEGYGTVRAIFWYLPPADATDGLEPGWYPISDEDDPLFDYPQNDREIPFGQGFLMNCGDGEAGVTYSGAVANKDFEKELDSGYNFTGNCSPVTVKLGDLTPNENLSFSGTDLQLLDAEGATDTIELEGYGTVRAIFWYLPPADATDGLEPGWYPISDEDDPLFDYPQNDREIPAGQGFLMNCGDSNAVITIPTALPTPVKE